MPQEPTHPANPADPADPADPARPGSPGNSSQFGTPAGAPDVADDPGAPDAPDAAGRPERSARRDRVLIAVFVVIACVLAWLAVLPLWIGQGLSSPLAGPLMLAMMFTPSIAALAVVFLVEKPRRKAAALGLVPVTPVGRLIGYLALGFAVPIALCAVALLIGAAVGVYPADFTGFSGFEQVITSQLAAAGVTELPLPLGALVASQLVNVAVAALFINLIPALGEEIGWRGWLLPKLLRYGAWPAIVISGVIWGLWHAPVILLGYNYPGTPGPVALGAMVVLCTLMGGLFGWLRLRGGSVWPAALAHSSLNAGATMYVLFFARGGSFDPLLANITGWTGWIAPAALLIAVVALGKFRPWRRPVAAD